MPELLLTAVGPDRPGLVDDFTGFLHDAGANLADSRMVNLRGQFAMLLLVEGSAATLEAVRRDVPAQAQRIGLHMTLEPGGAAADRAAGLPFRLRTYAMDQPGIVHRITHLLHQHRVNIEELQTRLEAGTFSGTPLFTMDMRITVPADVAVKQLRTQLEALCDALNCDVDLEPA